MQYRFIGEVAEDFPEPPIARTFQPGDVVELDKDPKHPRLVRVQEKPKAKEAD